jgi:hypothetical protein
MALRHRHHSTRVLAMNGAELWILLSAKVLSTCGFTIHAARREVLTHRSDTVLALAPSSAPLRTRLGTRLVIQCEDETL